MSAALDAAKAEMIAASDEHDVDGQADRCGSCGQAPYPCRRRWAADNIILAIEVWDEVSAESAAAGGGNGGRAIP